jgi:hypothetical protein
VPRPLDPKATHNLIRAGENCHGLFDVSGDDNVIHHNDASGGGFCAFPPE